MDAADLLNRLRRRKQRLAWSLSAMTVVATAAYFVAVTSDAPLLARVVLGRNITLAVVAAVLLIALSVFTVIVNARLANRIDALAAARARPACGSPTR